MYNGLKFWQILLTIHLFAMVLVVTSAYIGKPVVHYKEYDFYMHFILFGTTSYLAYRASNRRKEVFFNKLIMPFWPTLILLFSCVEETLQIFSEHRTFSLMDMISNVLGILAFYALDTLWMRWSFANK